MKKFFLFSIFYFLFSATAFPQIPYYYYPVPSGTTNNLYDISSLGNQRYLISGASGTILEKFYPDSNWNAINSYTTVDLNGYIRSEYDALIFNFLFGNNGKILQTTNQGANWIIHSSGYPNNLYAGIFPNVQSYSMRSIGVGSNGIILKRPLVPFEDSTWYVVPSGTTYDLKSICSKGRFIWVSGKNGTILNSIDTGNSFIQQFSLVTNNLNSISFLDISNGFVVGDGGVILKTTNGGINWIQKTSSTMQNLNCIYTLSSPNLWVAGNKTILYSTDNGESWNSDSGVPQYYFYSCSVINSNYYGKGILYIVGENGKIYRKTPDTLFRPNLYVKLQANNISSYFIRSGIFDQNNTNGNMAGFEWPKGSGKTAIFTAGLCIAAKVNGQLREAMASYKGEYSSGYCVNGNYYTNEYFKYYKVSKGDNAQASWDWAHWGEMVPYGAPFIDVNHNGIYEPAIDTPGVSNAKETIFYCMTDANPASHTSGEGFGGGTPPLGAEVHMTAWAYDVPGLQDVQFINFDIINKSTYTWNAVQMGTYIDPDLGDPNDDFMGCDTSLNLAFCYNGTNHDAVYGYNPPAVGISLLRGPLNRNVTPNVRLNMTGFTVILNPSSSPPPCEDDANGEANGAYLNLLGFKKDSTWRLDPTFNPYRKTKFAYTGDPETNVGWTEVKGSIWNCNHDTTGTLHSPNYIGERHSAFGSGALNFNIIPGESQKFVIAQLIARDSGNLKSVTKLKQLAAYVRSFYEQNFPININQVSTNIPDKFYLVQNYPNPFNPVTTIKYSIPAIFSPLGRGAGGMTVLKVYDILGREVKTLVSEFQNPGTYEVTFDGSNLASGVYFYRLVTDGYNETRKMILLK